MVQGAGVGAHAREQDTAAGDDSMWPGCVSPPPSFASPTEQTLINLIQHKPQGQA